MSKCPILSVDNLSREFKTHHHRVKALDNVSFQLHNGEALGIVGESGCGKSTLARIITQIETACSGDVLFEGQSIHTANSRQKYTIRRHIQMVFQNPALAISPKMTIGSFLAEAMINYNLKSRTDAKKQTKKLLEMVQLPADYVRKFPNELSGGELQRVAVARALSVQPKIIVFDEATSALDVLVRKKILTLLVALKKEFDLSYIFIGHNLAVVRLVTDRMIVMNQGRVVETIESEHFVSQAQHAYTKMLIGSILTTDDMMTVES